MITTIKDLVDICTSELQIREYREEYAANICSHWDSLIQWMDQNHYSEFTEDIGLLYCDETVGAQSGKTERLFRFIGAPFRFSGTLVKETGSAYSCH